MKIQQITPNYGQNKANPNFKAGKIIIINQDIFITKELEAIAKNNEFKKLAKIAGEKGSDLFIGQIFTSNGKINRHIASLRFDDIVYDLLRYGGTSVSDTLKNFKVNDMMKELEKKHQKELKEDNAREKVLKMIDDFNKTQETTNSTAPAEPAKKSFWGKIKDLFH